MGYSEGGKQERNLSVIKRQLFDQRLWEHRRERLINDDTKIAISSQTNGAAGYVFPKMAN
jgi:hypothetical protein